MSTNNENTAPAGFDALRAAHQAFVHATLELQAALEDCAVAPEDGGPDVATYPPCLPDFAEFASQVANWEFEQYAPPTSSPQGQLTVRETPQHPYLTPVGALCLEELERLSEMLEHGPVEVLGRAWKRTLVVTSPLELVANRGAHHCVKTDGTVSAPCETDQPRYYATFATYLAVEKALGERSDAAGQ
jgi:hypothetical protein